MSFEIKRARGKTAVFSGFRQPCEPASEIPKLQSLCVKKLIANASRIEHVGDVPFFMLRPVMEECSLHNLRRIESYNRHFLEEPESHELWERHCKVDFPGRLPLDGEDWRELYKRCERERNNRVAKIAKRIKRHEDRAEPQRQTRVVENQLSHNRGAISTVIKKTIRNHIPVRAGPNSSGSLTQSSSSSSCSRSSAKTTTTVVIRRDAGNGSSGSRLVKPKTAPLMQKSMQLFKSRFRR